MSWFRCPLIVLLTFAPFAVLSEVLAPVLVQTNTTFRIMACNLTSGNNQRYETAGLNILKALKADIVAVQEFNYSSASYGLNTTQAFREMIDQTFGTNFVYFRESGKSIPNGVISRFPIITSGVWADTQVTDRSFVWSRIDLPGTNDLYVVSVHLHSSGGASSRSTEATNLKNLIQSNFPTNAFIVVAGDLNTDSRTEAAVTTFKTFLSDNPIPTDQSGNPNTNEPRSKPYDYVLPSFTLNTNRVATVIGTRTFTNGLVFDSAVYNPLSEMSPVDAGDSHVFQMQHMGVVKDFHITYTTTNYVSVTAPNLTLLSTNILRWVGQSNVGYRVQTSSTLTNWSTVATVSSTSSNLAYTNANSVQPKAFYRVTYP